MQIVVKLDEKQEKMLNDWISKLPDSNEGAIGGRLEYRISSNNLGEVIKVVDLVSNEILDLTDYDSW